MLNGCITYTEEHLTSLRVCVPACEALCSKQTSQTLTGARPQPLSGTGAALEEQASQKPSPQARQWCLVSLSWKTVWHLWHTLFGEKNNNSRGCYWPRAWGGGRNLSLSKFYLVTCEHVSLCNSGRKPDSKHPSGHKSVDLAGAGGRGWGCVCHSPWWGSWVSSRPGRSDLSAKRWRPWQAWHWALTQTGPLGWLHPEDAALHCYCPLKSHLTATSRQVITT